MGTSAGALLQHAHDTVQRWGSLTAQHPLHGCKCMREANFDRVYQPWTKLLVTVGKRIAGVLLVLQ